MKKGAVIGILVSFHPLNILFLPDNLDEDQGETGKDGIWKVHTFPSVAHSLARVTSNPPSRAFCGFFREPTSASPACKHVLLLGACAHTLALSLPPFFPRTPHQGSPTCIFFLGRWSTLFQLLDGKLLTQPLWMWICCLLQQHAAVADRDLLVESSVFSYVSDARLCSLTNLLYSSFCNWFVGVPPIFLDSNILSVISLLF